MGFIQATIGHQMNARGFPEPFKKRVLGQLPDSEPQVPSRSEASSFYERYRQGNRRLSEALGNEHPELFSMDFETYPETTEPQWNRETSEAALGVLLDSISHRQEESEAELMELRRDASARRSRLASLIDRLDYDVHVWLSKVPFLGARFRMRMEVSAGRRKRSCYDR